MNMVNYREYRRKVFNTCMLECFSRIHESCTGLKCGTGDCHQDTLATMAKKMCDAFYTQRLQLDKCTIDQTKRKLCEAVTFIQDCINISETIAEDKMKVAQSEELEIDRNQEVELSPEDTDLIDKVFEEKNPQMQIDAIRDATVKALLEEDKKAQEIRDSLSIAQSQVSTGNDPKALEETVARLNSRGPTSLMNAIMNNVSAAAVKNVNENSHGIVPVGKVMAENADEIKTRASMMYMLYEMTSVFGIEKFTPAKVKAEAEAIYYNK